MSVVSSILIRITADGSGVARGVGQADAALTGLNRKIGTSSATLDQRLIRTGRGMQTFGKSMTRNVTIPTVAAFGLATKAAIDWESAFTGVRKTVEATPRQLKKLETGFRDMAEHLPATHEEIARVGEAAGQLGIKVPNILSFTRSMIDLGEAADDLTAEGAATALARIANITGMSEKDFDRLGSTVVDLGNKGAATEGEIVTFGLRIAGAGKLAGLAVPSILGIAEAFSSVGVPAERGGTAVQKVLNKMTEAVATGGNDLQSFAETAGMSADEFVKAFESRPEEAFTSFVEGLGKAGSRAFGIFRDLDLNDERLKGAFLALAKAGGMLRTSIETGNTAWKENNALTKEANRRYATQESQLKMLRNKLVNVGIDFGRAILPVLDDIVDGVQGVIEWFDSLSDGTKAAIVKWGLVAAALGPVVRLLGTITTLGGSAVKIISGLSGGAAAGAGAGAIGPAAAGGGGILGGLAAGAGTAGGVGILGSSGSALAAGGVLGAAVFANKLSGDAATEDWEKIDAVIVKFGADSENTKLALQQLAKDGVAMAKIALSDLLDETDKETNVDWVGLQKEHLQQLAKTYNLSAEEARQFATIQDDAVDVTKRQRRNIAALVEAYSASNIKLDKNTAQLAANLLQVGDYDGAMKLLRQNLIETGKEQGSFGRKSAEAGGKLAEVSNQAEIGQAAVRGFNAEVQRVKPLTKAEIRVETAAAKAAIASILSGLRSIAGTFTSTVNVVRVGSGTYENKPLPGASAKGNVVASPMTRIVGEGSYATPFGRGAEAILPLTDTILGKIGSSIATSGKVRGGDGINITNHFYGYSAKDEALMRRVAADVFNEAEDDYTRRDATRSRS